MAQRLADQVNDPADSSDSSRGSLDSDSAFNATPLHNTNSPKSNPTFMQNQISIQRSPSTIKDQASALSRKLSLKSNDSHSSNETNQGHHGIAGVLQTIPQGEEHIERGRNRDASDSSIAIVGAGNKLGDGGNSCTISKASSLSGKSVKSFKSAHSVHHTGAFPIGTLRVHSPSPTRAAPEETHEMLKFGDIIIVRDIPLGSLIGFDSQSFEIKQKDQLEGIKEFPPGVHFIWGGSSKTSLRNGFWIMSAKRATDEFGEIFVKRWDKYNEILAEEISAAEKFNQKKHLPEIEDKLISYNLSKLGGQETQGVDHGKGVEEWQKLTSCIKGALLTKLTRHKWNHWEVSSTHDYKAISPQGLLPGRDEVLAFIFPKDERTFTSTSRGRDRTEQAMDTSHHVKAVIGGLCTYEDSDEIVGEIQFCFITGMLLGNAACMEHWGHVVKIVFRAYRLVLELPDFYRKFLHAVCAQLMFDEARLDTSILDFDPDLRDDLKLLLITFKSRLSEQLLAEGSKLTDEQNEVGKAFDELETYLWKWGWDLRKNYVRSGKVQLEDGEMVDAELKDFQAEDERGLGQGLRKSFSRRSSRTGVRWKF